VDLNDNFWQNMCHHLGIEKWGFILYTSWICQWLNDAKWVCHHVQPIAAPGVPGGEVLGGYHRGRNERTGSWKSEAAWKIQYL